MPGGGRGHGFATDSSATDSFGNTARAARQLTAAPRRNHSPNRNYRNTAGMPATRQAMEVDRLARQPSRQRNAEPLPSRAEVAECELCRREVDRYTVHHLVPRAKGGRFGPKAKLCATCHRQLHALFSEATLAQELNSIPRLQANHQVHDYLKWVRKQKSPGGFRVRRANNRR